MPPAPLRLLFAGNYEPGYNRTAIIRAGLLKLGHSVLEFPFKKRDGAAKKELLRLLTESDGVFMPSFTHKDVPFVKQAAGPGKVVFDPLVSRYMTKALDYRNISRFGLSALRNRYFDGRALRTADFVVTDTLAHLDWFHSSYGIPVSKMGVLYIGNDFDEFFPAPGPAPAGGKYVAGFYGGFNPLQGVINILKAAELLNSREDILFRVIGDGFEYKKARAFAAAKKLGNVEFTGRVELAALRRHIQGFDAALGIFGETLKATLVIPNKVYHYASCRKPVITRDTPAARELFADGESALLVDGSPASIAGAVLRLKADGALADRLAGSAYEKIRRDHDELKTAARLAEIFYSLPPGPPGGRQSP